MFGIAKILSLHVVSSISVECLIPRLGWNSYLLRLGWNNYLPGWDNYLGSILRLGWNNYLDGTTTWVRTCVLRPLGHSLYQLSYVEHLPAIPERKRKELAGEVTRELQVVGNAASIAIRTWVRSNDKSKARAEEREKNIGWIGRMFTAWRVSHAERREERV